MNCLSCFPQFRVLATLSALLTILLGRSWTPPSAQAILVNTHVDGLVTFADPANTLGVNPGDISLAHAFYEGSLVSPLGPSVVSIDSDPSFFLTVVLGTETFVETQDFDFGFGFPQLTFQDGLLNAINFLVNFSQTPSPMPTLTYQSGFPTGSDFFVSPFGSSTFLIQGEWDLATATTTPIPEPSTLLLLGSGIIGLLGWTVGRKNKRAKTH